MHVFKNPNPLSHTPSSKPADNHSRTPPSNVAWPISTTPSSRSDSQRKHSLSVPQDTRGTLSTHATPFDPKRSKSRPYGIYPSAIADTYIYERSMSSASDILASADSSSSSDESDLTESVVSLNIEISSTRASSSTETLDSTLAPSPPQTPRRIEATPPRPSTSSAIPPTPVPATELVRIRSQSPTSGRLNTQTSHSPPSNLRRRPTVETVSDDDSETVVSEEGREIDRLPGDASGGSSVRPTSGTAPRRSPQPEVLTPVSRSPNDRLPAHPRIREAVAISRSSSRHANLSPVEYRGMSGSPPYDDPSLRTPPGLNGISNPVPPATSVRNSSSSSPHNHHLAPLHIGGLVESTVTISARRCVRWNDNLVCPSPIPRSQRRKGWYNCRGSVVVTNPLPFKGTNRHDSPLVTNFGRMTASTKPQETAKSTHPISL